MDLYVSQYLASDNSSRARINSSRDHFGFLGMTSLPMCPLGMELTYRHNVPDSQPNSKGSGVSGEVRYPVWVRRAWVHRRGIPCSVTRSPRYYVTMSPSKMSPGGQASVT